jgi:hypothetical protein
MRGSRAQKHTGRIHDSNVKQRCLMNPPAFSKRLKKMEAGTEKEERTCSTIGFHVT